MNTKITTANPALEKLFASAMGITLEEPADEIYAACIKHAKVKVTDEMKIRLAEIAHALDQYLKGEIEIGPLVEQR